MDIHAAYAHCVRCGAPTTPEEKYVECTVCKHRIYFNPVPCNAVILQQEDGKILLVKRKFNPHKGEWDLPGGFIDLGENLDQSVKREMFEELHLQVELQRIVGTYTDTYTFQDIEMPTLGMIVLGKIVGGRLQVDDDVEDILYASEDEMHKLKIAFTAVRTGIKDFFAQQRAYNTR